MSIKRFASASVAVALLVAGAGCGKSSPVSSNGDSSSSGSNQIYANWSEIAIDANLSKTRVTSTGHFETAKNSCNRPANGAMSMTEWNDFAANVNEAMRALTPDQPKNCIEIDPRNCLDGTAQIVKDDGTKVSLFEPGEYGQICSHIANKDLMQKLFKSINGVIYAADRTDCTLEWERCTR